MGAWITEYYLVMKAKNPHRFSQALETNGPRLQIPAILNKKPSVGSTQGALFFVISGDVTEARENSIWEESPTLSPL